MARLTEFWENFDRYYDDFEKEGLNLDDLQLKSKLNFYLGSLQFSSKSRYNFGSVVGANHDFGLKHKTPTSVIDVKTKPGENSVEAEFRIYKQGDLEVGGHTIATVKQTAEKSNTDATVNLRVHHKDNVLVTLGLRDWDFINTSPRSLALGASFGRFDRGLRLTFNAFFNFSLENKHLNLIRFLIKGSQGSFTGSFLTNVNRTVSVVDEKPEVLHAVDLALKFTESLNIFSKIGATISHDVNSKNTDAVFVGSHIVDRVRLNGKVSTKRDLTLGVTSVHDDITFSFAVKAALATAVDKTGEVEVKRHWLNYKFGASVELNRL